MKASLLAPALTAFTVLLVPSAAHAIPFVPSDMEVTSIAARFVETGTDTACVNCEDADPLNDLILTLGDFGAGGAGGYGTGGAVLSMVGHLESIREAEPLGIEYDVRVVSYYGIGSLPEELAAYPLQSVIYGTLSGYVRGTEGLDGLEAFDIVEDCCGGVIGSAMFKSPLGPGFWQATNALSLITEFHWGAMPYTPEVSAVPEPASLLLLGSGVVAVGLRRCKRACGCSAVPRALRKEFAGVERIVAMALERGPL